MMNKLQTKTKIPLLGLGTYKMVGRECVDGVKKALELGYRHFDTADVYGNHEAIGEAIKGFEREKLFITSKLFTQDLTKEQVAKKVPQFLKELGIEQLDLLLIHWPSKEVPVAETLKAMLQCKEKGLVKGIGVSNFVRFHLKEMEPYLDEIVTNQVEMHPYLQRKELKKAYEEAGISITAYRPIAKGAFVEDATLTAIGEKYHKTPSQVALRWLIQNDIVAIPKASTLAHLKENIDIFDFSLEEEEVKAIDELDQSRRYCTPSGLPVYDD